MFTVINTDFASEIKRRYCSEIDGEVLPAPMIFVAPSEQVPEQTTQTRVENHIENIYHIHRYTQEENVMYNLRYDMQFVNNLIVKAISQYAYLQKSSEVINAATTNINSNKTVVDIANTNNSHIAQTAVNNAITKVTNNTHLIENRINAQNLLKQTTLKPVYNNESSTTQNNIDYSTQNLVHQTNISSSTTQQNTHQQNIVQPQLKAPVAQEDSTSNIYNTNLVSQVDVQNSSTTNTNITSNVHNTINESDIVPVNTVYVRENSSDEQHSKPQHPTQTTINTSTTETRVISTESIPLESSATPPSTTADTAQEPPSIAQKTTKMQDILSRTIRQQVQEITAINKIEDNIKQQNVLVDNIHAVQQITSTELVHMQEKEQEKPPAQSKPQVIKPVQILQDINKQINAKNSDVTRTRELVKNDVTSIFKKNYNEIVQDIISTHRIDKTVENSTVTSKKVDTPLVHPTADKISDIRTVTDILNKRSKPQPIAPQTAPQQTAPSTQPHASDSVITYTREVAPVAPKTTRQVSTSEFNSTAQAISTASIPPINIVHQKERSREVENAIDVETITEVVTEKVLAEQKSATTNRLQPSTTQPKSTAAPQRSTQSVSSANNIQPINIITPITPVHIRGGDNMVVRRSILTKEISKRLPGSVLTITDNAVSHINSATTGAPMIYMSENVTDTQGIESSAVRMREIANNIQYTAPPSSPIIYKKEEQAQQKSQESAKSPREQMVETVEIIREIVKNENEIYHKNTTEKNKAINAPQPLMAPVNKTTPPSISSEQIYKMADKVYDMVMKRIDADRTRNGYH